MKERKGLNRLLIIVISACLVLLSYFSIIRNNFADAQKTGVFLKQSNTYYYVASILKAEVKDKLPENIQNNILKNAVANKLVDVIVTPEVVEKISQPAIKAAYRVAKTPTEIVGDQVVINTAQYKSQITEQIKQYNLPETVDNVSDSIISAVPAQLKIVDLKERPNSILGYIIRARALFDRIDTTINVLWWVIAVGGIALVLINLRMVKRLFSSFAWAFATSGIFMIVGSFVLPYLIRYLVPKSTDPLVGDYVNGMVNELLKQVFVLSRAPAFWYIVVAAFFYAGYKLLPLDKFQKWFDKTAGLKRK